MFIICYPEKCGYLAGKYWPKFLEPKQPDALTSYPILERYWKGSSHFLWNESWLLYCPILIINFDLVISDSPAFLHWNSFLLVWRLSSSYNYSMRKTSNSMIWMKIEWRFICKSWMSVMNTKVSVTQSVYIL